MAEHTFKTLDDFYAGNLISSPPLHDSISILKCFSMVAPAFGFSVGDFVSVIQLVGKVSKALKDTGGAEDDFKLLYQELSQLQIVLEQLRDLPPSASVSQNHFNAVRGMALAVQIPLQEFLDKIEKFKIAFESPKSHFSELRKAGRKAQWAVWMQEEVNKIRSVVTMKIVTISVLLTLPNGCVFFQPICFQETYVMQRDTLPSRSAVKEGTGFSNANSKHARGIQKAGNVTDRSYQVGSP